MPPLGELPEYILTLSADGRLLYGNRPLAGRSPAELLGVPMAELIPEAHRATLLEALRGVVEGGEEVSVELGDAGRDRWFECRLAPLRRGDEIVAVVIVAMEVTRRKRAEDALRISEARLRALLASIPDMLFRFGSDGAYLDYGGPPERPFVPPEEFLGRSVEEVLPAEAAASLRAAMGEAKATGAVATAEYRLPLPGGERAYEARLIPSGDGELLALVRDRTEERRAQSALASSERNFRRVIEQMPDSVLIHRGGQILYVNRACVEMMGYPGPEALVGRQVVDFIHEDDRTLVVERVRAAAETGATNPPVELRVLRQDRTIATVDLAPVQVIELEDGPASLVVGRDVSHRKKMQDRLLLADRVASMGKLAAGMVHEINNPLTFVVGNLTVAARKLTELSGMAEDPAPLLDLEKVVADARAGADRVRDIVGDLRAFSRPDGGAEELVDLRRALDGAISMAWSEIRHRARLVREYGDTALVRGSGTRLSQVFLNLLVNAAQAIEEGGAAHNTIEVITGTDEEGRSRVEIWDTGRGFTPEIARHMWDPFYTTKAPGEGTGLGLSICLSIVTSLGGEITGEHFPGEGTVFRVVLPRAVGDVSPPAPSPATPTPVGPTRRGRILVVDDEPVIASFVRRVLEGHEVYSMTSGRDALELCRELAFDVILCDLMMPDVTGMELYERLREDVPGAEQRVVFMTAGAFTRRAGEFLATVTNPVLEKPFEVDELVATVERALAAR